MTQIVQDGFTISILSFSISVRTGVGTGSSNFSQPREFPIVRDEIGTVSDAGMKNSCVSRVRAKGAIVGTTLHVHIVTHRKLFINETPPLYYCSEISCPTCHVHAFDVFFVHGVRERDA